MGFLCDQLRGQKTRQRPIWLMRQAGRYLPEYRALRQEHPDFLSLVYHPSHACEVTLQPLRRFGMDAAILFSDILVIPHALGQDVRFVQGEGPQLPPLQKDDIEKLSLKEQGTLSKVYETIRSIRHDLIMADKDLIGFAGAPWTVACYMIQGHGKTGFPKALEAWQSDREHLLSVIDHVTQATKTYLSGQINAGAQVIQLFDSWAGLISQDKNDFFEQVVLDPAKKILSFLKQNHPDIPVICFPRGLPKERLEHYADQIKPEGLSLSEEIDLNWAVEALPEAITLQGNLSPDLLLVGGKQMLDQAKNICDIMGNRRFIFNLGHGVIKETPPEHVKDLVDFVHSYGL